MSKLPLTFACGLYDRMLALHTGEVRVDGVDLNFLMDDNPRNIFDRMAAGLEFDSAEFSSSEYVSRFVAGNCPLVAIPVFASRVFRHSFIFINKKYIKSPKELEGKRIGVPLYTMTAAIFIRGLLSDEYGIDFSKNEWVEGDINSAKAHGNPTILPTAKKMSISANTSGKSMSKMLEDGELQAIIGTGVPEAFGRNPDIVRLYPDYRSAEIDYYNRTKIFPIMHTVVIRRDVHEKHPFVASALYHALNQSKNLALKKMKYRGTLRYMLPWMTEEMDQIDAVFGGDPWPYGIEANRPTLNALVRYLEEQGVIAKAPKVDDLFVPVRQIHEMTH
ncbi:MAG: ABC transporter substrate-binding protein [Hyphomicrobiales bacterium]|nr:ABC transporter substrate-binding protein [Alphaproteobacteria bacterium]